MQEEAPVVTSQVSNPPPASEAQGSVERAARLLTILCGLDAVERVLVLTLYEKDIDEGGSICRKYPFWVFFLLRPYRSNDRFRLKNFIGMRTAYTNPRNRPYHSPASRATSS